MLKFCAYSFYICVVKWDWFLENIDTKKLNTSNRVNNESI